MVKYELFPLKRFRLEEGDVLKGVGITDSGFVSFGEVYFSQIKRGKVKGWKKHTVAQLNIVVPVGSVEFVIKDFQGNVDNIVLGEDNYQRLVIPRGLWFAFKGLADNSTIMSLTNIIHDPNESENKRLLSPEIFKVGV